MLSDERVLRYLGDGMGHVVATADASGQPACCRGVGLHVEADRASLTVYLPIATSAETIANIASNGRVAIVSTHLIDHGAVQVKGRSRSVRVAGADEQPRVRAWLERFAETLEELGMPKRLTRSLAHWPAFAVCVEIESVFEQTPGPRAGELLRARAE